MKQVYKLPPCADALRLVLEPQPEGGYTTTCPVIPNLVTEADTLEDVPAYAADAPAALIELWHNSATGGYAPVPDWGWVGMSSSASDSFGKQPPCRSLGRLQTRRGAGAGGW